MDHEHYYYMSYNLLKRCLFNDPDAIEIVKDPKMKRILIDGEQKYDFIWFLWDAPSDLVDSLLDEEGIKILRETEYLEDKLNALLTASAGTATLLKKNSFCEIIMEHLSFLGHYFNNIDEQGAITFIHFVKENHPDQLKSIFVRLSNRSQRAVVEQVDFPFEIVKNLVKTSNSKATEYFLSTDLRIDTLADFSFDDLYVLSTKSVHIPPALLDEKMLVSRITAMENVKNYRFLINNFSESNDTSFLESVRKRYYDGEIYSFLREENMLKRYYDAYQLLCLKMDQESNPVEVIEDIMQHYFHYSNDEPGEYEIRREISTFYHDKDKDGLRKFLERESHLQLTNMIIDYHFEEVPYNFFLDVNQLVQFQEKEKTLTEEEYNRYCQLLNLDKLSYEDAFCFHEELKKYPMKELYYDHFREAKDRASTLMQNAILNEQSIQKYKLNDLSALEGVDIYMLDGDEFYAFVKSLPISKIETPLKKESITYNADGGSYSLDGSDKLQTYRDPKAYYNVIYSSFPKDQVVHMFSVDSFSKYNRDYGVKATDRIYELSTPKDFINKSNFYDEIILSLPNNSRRDELNETLEKPKLLGIYCYDTITANDVISAKNLGVGIVLVNTKSYNVKRTVDKVNLYDTMTIGSGEQNPFNYLEDVNGRDMNGRRR